MSRPFFRRALCAAVLAGMLTCQAGAVGTSAVSAVLLEGESGRVLYAQNADEERLIASITKIMTAVVALEHGDVNAPYTVTAEDMAEGSSMYLTPGEELTLEELLYGLMLVSGNDAALAVAHCVAGDEASFVELMNETAARLGMTHTSFANPNGLDAEGHCSSARDMAILARACLENEVLAKIAATKSITLGARSFTNHNKLLWRYEGCVGLKTGYTKAAGRTLVSAARREGMTLVCVTLNAPSDWADHTALFDWGFSGYEARALVREGERAGRLPVYGGLVPVCPVTAGEDLTAALAPGERVDTVWELTETALTAPVEAGARVGEIVYRIGPKELARVSLVTGGDVPLDLAEPSGWLGGIWERIAGL